MRKMFSVVLLIFIFASSAYAGVTERIAFKGIDSLGVECSISASNADLEAVISDQMFVSLKSKLPKIKIIDGYDRHTLNINVTATESDPLAAFVDLSLCDVVKIREEETIAITYQRGYCFISNSSSFEAELKKYVDRLLDAFIADFYKARPDL